MSCEHESPNLDRICGACFHERGERIYGLEKERDSYKLAEEVAAKIAETAQRGFAEVEKARDHYQKQWLDSNAQLEILDEAHEELKEKFSEVEKRESDLQIAINVWADYCFKNHGNDAMLYNGLKDLAKAQKECSGPDLKCGCRLREVEVQGHSKNCSFEG